MNALLRAEGFDRFVFLRSPGEWNPEMKCRVWLLMALFFLAQRCPGGLSPFFPELLFGHIDSELAHQFRDYSETLAVGQPIAIFVVFETR